MGASGKHINWDSNWQGFALLNPRLAENEKNQFESLVKEFPLQNHIWISSSGSESLKLIALSKDAFLSSAGSVNEHLQATSKDVWGLALPSFHVGGLSIFARAHLTSSKIFEFDNEWSAEKFVQFLVEKNVTLTSLVPTQVFDLVTANVKAPKNLRAIVVGGAHLSESLYQKAKALGWPLLPSFGMTECCSQVATANLNNPDLKILPHLQLKTDGQGQLSVKGSSLLTGYAQIIDGARVFTDPKSEGWYETSDFGKIEGDFLKVFGRGNDFVKINGEGVNLPKLREKLDEIALAKNQHLMAVGDERTGHKLVLFSEVDCDNLVQNFNQKVLPFERITQIIRVEKIPRSSLGKVLTEALASQAKL